MSRALSPLEHESGLRKKRRIGNCNLDETMEDNLDKNVSDNMEDKLENQHISSKLPVEIFTQIASYLDRSDVKSMRLVCKEWEQKLSSYFFRKVVVPFRAQLYSTMTKDGSDPNARIKSPSDEILHDGQRIFTSFGALVNSFILSFRLDEATLATPPIKSVQEAVPTFWGIYRWPQKSYLRFSDVAVLEQTADETTSMRQAFSQLANVWELGIRCDAGRGYLTGLDNPDFWVEDLRENVGHIDNTMRSGFDSDAEHRARETVPRLVPQKKYESTFSPATSEHLARFHADGLLVPDRTSRVIPDTSGIAFKGELLKRMIVDAGFAGDEVEHAMQLLINTEGCAVERPYGAYGMDELMADSKIKPWPLEEPPMTRSDLAALATAHAWPAGQGRNHSLTRMTRVRRAVCMWGPAIEYCASHPLHPKDLTRAQKELLLEMEWAHRALIQSFVMSIIGNHNISANCLTNLTVLTISQIPSGHVQMFQRHEFWCSVPNVNKLTLGVIADWRHIVNSAPGCIKDVSVPPIDAVDDVFCLLSKYVAKHKNVKHLHFEWICGGEFARGVIQRNSHILPAPFTKTAALMVENLAAKSSENVLYMPHISHLSLKNCYFSPHVFLQSVRRMAMNSLRMLDLESVSLTGPPSPEPLPDVTLTNIGFVDGQPALTSPLLNHRVVRPHMLPNLQGHYWTNDAFVPDVSSSISSIPPFTWTGIIEQISPGLTLQSLRDEAGTGSGQSHVATRAYKYFFPEAAAASLSEGEEAPLKLKYIGFKSCGYVAVSSNNIATIAVVPPTATYDGMLKFTTDQRQIMRMYMQEVSSEWPLGTVVRYVKPQERYIMTELYGLRFGWEGLYSEDVIEKAISDGIVDAGQWRFSGTLSGEDRLSDRNLPSAIMSQLVNASAADIGNGE